MNKLFERRFEVIWLDSVRDQDVLLLSISRDLHMSYSELSQLYIGIVCDYNISTFPDDVPTQAKLRLISCNFKPEAGVSSRFSLVASGGMS